MKEYRAIFEDVQGNNEIGSPKDSFDEAFADRGIDDNTGGLSGKSIIGVQIREVEPWRSISLADILKQRAVR